MTPHDRSTCDLCRRYAPDPPRHTDPRYAARMTRDEGCGLTIDELINDEKEKEWATTRHERNSKR